jgi:hypothetical protein
MQEHNLTPNKILTFQDKSNENNPTNYNNHPEQRNISAQDIKTEIALLTRPNKNTPQHQEQLSTQEKKKTTDINPPIIPNNPFPTHVFPLPIQQIITETNRTLNFPIDFIGASILYAASVAIGNTHRVEVKKGWLESPVLYLAIVAKAGTNKSHPLSFALHPIIEQDKKNYRQYEQQRKEYEQQQTLSKKERTSNTNQTNQTYAANPNQSSLEEPSKPVWKKILLSDFTPEALAEVHKYNQRGIGVHVDELAGWFKNFNRYNKGSEMEFWLSVWSGKPINIDRKTGEPVFIPLPFISVAGTIQNSILHELAKENRSQNGFIDRMLFVIPDNLQKPYWTETELDPDIIQDWDNILFHLMSLPIQFDETQSPQATIMKFSPEAKQILFDWQKQNADECNKAEHEPISGIYSKLEMYAVRLALILELLQYASQDNPKQTTIGIKATQAALTLVAYFKKSAIKVNAYIANTSPLDKYPTDKTTLYETLPDTFSTETGLQTAATLNIPERTFKRFLNDKELFDRISRGEYEKRI